MAFFALYSQAQFYSSEACFFIKAGEDPKKSINSWKIILFKGKEAFNFYTTRSDFEYIKNCLKKNPNYFDNKDCGDYQKKLSHILQLHQLILNMSTKDMNQETMYILALERGTGPVSIGIKLFSIRKSQA